MPTNTRVAAHSESPESLADRGGVRPYFGTLDALLDPHVLIQVVRDDHDRTVDFICSQANAAACDYLGMERGRLVGARLLDVLPERAGMQLLPLLNGTMETGQPLVLDDFLYSSETYGWERRYDARVVRVRDGLSCTWCDVTQRNEIEDSLRRRVGELDSIHRISQLLAERSDLEGALAAAGCEIDKLFDARSSRILVVPEGDEAPTAVALETVSAAGAAPTECEAGVIEAALQSRSPAVLESCDECARHLLAVPMVTRSRLVGVVTVVRGREAASFTAHELTVAESVADALAAAIENERLHQRETRQAAVDERQRLARELHDSVTQTLYSASLISEVLPATTARDLAEGLHNLETLRRLMRTALCEMRTLLFELRPETLATASLESLLERLGDALTVHADTAVRIVVDEEAELPVEVKLVFYRVAQEALTNISKHAHASQATLAVVGDSEGTRLSVRDDGTGFDSAVVRPGSMGLCIMRERAQEIGADLRIASPAAGGTEVSMEWRRPLAGAAALRGGA